MKLDYLIDEFLEQDSDEKKIEIFQDIKNNLGYDDLNTEYFLSVASKYRKQTNSRKQIFIFEENLPKPIGDHASIAWPTAILDESMFKYLPHVSYEELTKKYAGKKCDQVVLWIKKMQAGTGSSIERKRYLSQLFKQDFESVKIGAKGTDLFVDLAPGVRLSIVELQILQAIRASENKIFAGVIMQDIVSKETEKALEEIWHKKSPFHAGKTYMEVIEAAVGLGVFEHIFQYQIPTIDEEGEFSFNRVAPAGHGLFGVEALKAAIVPKYRPDVTDKTLISSIGNGEDLGSSPDEVMVSWMHEEDIPIAMVTTTKTNIDLKGGQIALLKDGDDYFATIIEKAQAEQSNQLQLFYDMGLRDNDQDAFFNTNMVLINYNVLIPKIEKLVQEMGVSTFFQEVGPDLIINLKKQKDEDLIERKYIQLEGALGSVILNLDRLFRKKYKRPLVHFLNVEANYRDKFFSPIKSGFDFFMQFYSDRFKLDLDNFKLLNQRPGNIPMVDLKDDYYKDVYNVLSDFANTKILDLDRLDIEGVVACNNLTLKGRVSIVNKLKKKFDLSHYAKEHLKEMIFDNKDIVIDENEKVIIKSNYSK